MLADIKEWIKNVIFSRLFLLTIIIGALFFVLVQKLFVLQIINGEDYLNNFTLTIKKEISLPGARGNIYDRNGNLLAYNELAYSVTIEDNYEATSDKNLLLNDTIIRTVNLIESCGDEVNNDFKIVINRFGHYEYVVSDTRLLRFLADVYGHAKLDELTEEERNSTAVDVIRYLCSKERYQIGTIRKNEEGEDEFLPMQGYSEEEILKIITVRYAMSTNSYQKYLSTVIASQVSPETVAAILECSNELQGVSIAENMLRRYNDTQYFAHIIGYVGNASTEDLEELSASTTHEYDMTDIVGKAGIEKTMEDYLQGKKGRDVVFTDNVGKILETDSHEDPVAGQDVYLSIDSDLQKAVYNMLEQKLAGILVTKIINMKEYNNSEVKSSNMMIPIDDVYYALVNNNVIDINKFAEPNAHTYEKQVYASFASRQAEVLDTLRDELLNTATPYDQLNKEKQVYESYIVTRLMSSSVGILKSDLVDRDDKTYINWTINETISLKEYLNYCLAQNWIDISKFHTDSTYSDTSEIYVQLVDYILNDLKEDTGFSKRIYRYMIKDSKVTGKELCLIMFEQRVIYGTSAEKEALETGARTPYDFIINKISNIELTPAQLALDPCSGSCVVLSTTGEVLACVSYPGYNNNRLTNTIDADYYAELMNDLASPMYNHATQQMTAPGSTFKMVTAITGLESGMINLGESLTCRGSYEIESLNLEKTCWVYPGAHGHLDVTHAIENSCNSFFYEVGYRLATNLYRSTYSETAGLEKLRIYADQFGLTEKTGVEMEENEPQFSDTLPIDSAIGQGSHNYTTIGLARYVDAIANRGTCYELTLVDAIKDSEGNTVRDYTPTVRNTLEVPGEYWDAVQYGMRLVVNKTAAFKHFPINVAGKTGTAQTSTSRTNHALFVGFAPYENPEIAVSVRIAYGYTSANAAALASDVMKYYFELEDKSELINGIANVDESQEVIED
ncbi:MAG: penicillin-binding protein [Lachnospiraceae bacterium]|nr:penicillin-binding protein [Lachnospiraceae bacterium]